MIREATEQDIGAMDVFLARHAASSMFLRSNLAAHGLQEKTHPHGTQFFLWEDEGLKGVFGVTNGGYLMAQAPDCPDNVADAFAKVLAGRNLLGMTGEVTITQKVLVALGLENAAFMLLDDEPLYQLELDTLPDTILPCRKMTESDAAALEPWFADYLVDTSQVTPDTIGDMAKNRALEAAENGAVRLLLEEGEPVAMAALNAQVGADVQVGGVFAPRDQRGKGQGRRVTVALLQNARANGAKRAILFANNPPAARAYEAIGFQQLGYYRIALLEKPHKVPG